MKAGRANPTILDRIEVEYYGSMMPLNQVANVSAPEPRMLLIQPWEKSTLKAIEKAILKSDLGLNPTNDGSVIRLLIPELTEETRRNLVKQEKDRKILKLQLEPSEEMQRQDKSYKERWRVVEDEIKSEDDIQRTDNL